MAEGLEIPRRRTSDGPPSDLPSKRLFYPGKPLAHRYAPTEQVRKVEEDKIAPGSKLAGEAPFSSITSIKFPDKNIRLGPVINAKPRALQPLAAAGRVILPTNRNAGLPISEAISKPTQARAEQLAAANREPGLSTENPNLPTLRPTENEPDQQKKSAATETIRGELDRLKEAASQELAQRQAPPPPPETTSRPPVAAASPATPTPSLPNEGMGEITDAETRNLLAKAERLESELAQLREGIAAPIKEAAEKSTRDQLKLKAEEERYESQIKKLVADRNTLLQKVNDLTSSHSIELNKRKAAEKELQEASREFERKLAQFQIDKTNLLGKIQQLEGVREEITESNALKGVVENENSELKNRLSTVEKERDETKEHLKKLEAFIESLRQEKPPKEAAPEPAPGEPATDTIVAKKPSSQPREEMVIKPVVKVVKPRPAVGKMAPSLTSTPNVINGIIKDAEGLLLPNVIIVVKDSTNQPVRALKSNKIGQFAISTPLPNGTYTMELEAAGHSFDLIQVEVTGTVLAPIEIRANN